MFARLDGKVAVVTGAGRGIGRAIAQVFARHGGQILVATRSGTGGGETVAAIRDAGGAAALCIADVADRGACESLVVEAVKAFGRLDILVHNAGIFPVSRIDDLADDELEAVFATNLKAAFHLSRAAVRVFPGGGGRLLFTSSVTGPRVAMEGFAAYAASKSGLNGFIRTAALEYAARGVTVNGVEPGFIRTSGTAALGAAAEVKRISSRIPAGRFGHVDDVAYAMLFLASEQAGYITGQTLVVDGGSTLPEV